MAESSTDNSERRNYAEDHDEFAESIIWDDMPGPYKRVVQSVYHSPTCKYIYLGILIFSCALGVWVIIDSMEGTFPPSIFYVFEFLINLALLSDVLVRMWLNGCYRFWHSISNVFQLALVSACFVLTIITIAR